MRSSICFLLVLAVVQCAFGAPNRDHGHGHDHHGHGAGGTSFEPSNAGHGQGEGGTSWSGGDSGHGSHGGQGTGTNFERVDPNQHTSNAQHGK